MRTLYLQCTAFSVLLVLIISSAWGNLMSQENTGKSSGQHLTAEQLASWVLEVNPGLAAIQAAAEAAAYRIDPAGSLDDPVLSYGIAPLTHDSSRGINQRFDVSQKIPWPGTLAARKAAARNDALAVSSEADMLQLLVITQTKAAYAEWHFIHEALNIHHATQALLDELTVATQVRYATGLATKQDALQAEVELNNLKNQELILLRQQVAIQARINALLNRVPDASLPEAEPIVVSRRQPPTFQELQALALTHHPEFSQLNAQISAGESRITLAEKAFLPDFQVGMGYNSLWDDADKRTTFGVSINIPLDRSKRKSVLNQARADTRRAEWLLVERRAELLADLAQARAEVIEAQSSVALYQDKLVPLAEEYLESAIADYQSGAGGFLNVITAEQRKLTTDLAHARARADYVRRLAELERWTGASINLSLPTSTGVKQ
ncbi:Outer membrane protein TolC [Nitrosomonas aestuarii]|uniref:Outer membrane protein TolC n=2 Tax=Nitrosomonas aestuarii TaxID=52441 RepID=A0A1I4FJI6_9PROT|nr:Outer membrane protein TolC [Nitrosomonas aestuarii]